MRPGDCEIVNEIYLEIRENIYERAVDISIVIDNLADAAEHIASCRKMIFEDNLEVQEEK